MNYLQQINWIDICIAILLIRILYIAIKTGFLTEFFKLLGTVSAIYIACHYYVKVGDFLNRHIPLEGESWVNFLNFFAFFLLAFLGYFIFVLIRRFLLILIKMEAISPLNRWGAFILGTVRGALFTSVLLVALTVLNNAYLKNSLTDSLLRPKLFKLTPTVYAALWNNLMFRFMDKEVFNTAVLDIGHSFTK